jgi:glycosyltransferase involved in cell wall biosynthesis
MVRLFKKKILIDVRDLWTDVAVSLSYISKDSIMLKAMRKFERYSLEKADLILTNSKIIYDNLVQTLTKSRNKIKYYPFQVNLKSFKYSKGVPRKTRLVYIGNLGAAQNLEALISAIPSVIKCVPDIDLHFFGGGDREQDLKELVIRLKLDKFIHFNNPVPREQIPGILSESMVGIIALSSSKAIRYAIPTKSFEYFASGLPVVAYGASEELEKILFESDAGIYVNGNDELEIARAIIKIMTDKESFDKFSNNGRNFVENNSFHSIQSEVKSLATNQQIADIDLSRYDL